MHQDDNQSSLSQPRSLAIPKGKKEVNRKIEALEQNKSLKKYNKNNK